MRIVALAGCFWGLEHALSRLPCVATRVGYAGGRAIPAPTYYNLDANGNFEAVEVTFVSTSIDSVVAECLAHSDRDPSPSTNPRYRRAFLCPDGESLAMILARDDVRSSSFEVAKLDTFIEAEPYHRRYYERTWA